MSANIIELVDAKKQLGLDNVTTYDDDLQLYVDAATVIVEYYAGPQLQRDETRTFDGGTEAVVMPWPFTTLVSLLENGNDITSTVIAHPETGVIRAGTMPAYQWYTDLVYPNRYFAIGIQNIVVTATVGSTTIAPNVRLAARELVRFWWQQGRQGNRPGFGNEIIDTPDVPSGFAVPRRVVELLTADRLIGGFA